jgi:nicotinate-nucleotide adenylyltransferase
MAEKVALFGGTFDPVHHGHLITARAVAEATGMARITLVPTACPPHKRAAGASSADRLAMLRLAVKDDALFDLCMLELRRPGPSYTIDTVETILAERGPTCQVSVIVGADMLEGVASWHRADELLRMVTLVVACRPGAQDGGNAAAVLSGALGGKEAAGVSMVSVATPLLEVSSSDIRRRIAEGRSIRYLTPDNVLCYIQENGLYRPSGGA